VQGQALCEDLSLNVLARAFCLEVPEKRWRSIRTVCFSPNQRICQRGSVVSPRDRDQHRPKGLLRTLLRVIKKKKKRPALGRCLGAMLWSSGFRGSGFGLKVWGSGFGVWGLGFGVWVWGLGFGVWSLGLGV
jgi:hypothetical protein